MAAEADGLVDALEKTLTAKLKGDAVKQEIDRNEDLLRSARPRAPVSCPLLVPSCCALFRLPSQARSFRLIPSIFRPFFLRLYRFAADGCVSLGWIRLDLRG